jgi:hypothetical protein
VLCHRREPPNIGLQADRRSWAVNNHLPTKRWVSLNRRRLNPGPLCAKKLGVSDKVQVPMGQGLTTHPYRVLQHGRRS